MKTEVINVTEWADLDADPVNCPQGHMSIERGAKHTGSGYWCGECGLRYVYRIIEQEKPGVTMRKALEAIADRYHADRCPVYQFSGGKGACNCHVGIARAALAASQVPATDDTVKGAEFEELMCEVCLETFTGEDDVTYCCDLCGRCGFCEECSSPDRHDCEPETND